jgi:hypothetical protein
MRIPSARLFWHRGPVVGRGGRRVVKTLAIRGPVKKLRKTFAKVLGNRDDYAKFF